MPFDFEREALVASGIKDDNRVVDYLKKLDALHGQIKRQLLSSQDPLTRARRLFEWLWKDRPTRYRPKGPFRLSDVIDAQMGKERQVVGNCLGLTLLYNSLLRKMGINAGALYLENAFGVGPHVLTRLELKAGTIDIENILPEGFDHKGHFDDPSRTIWGDRDLVADIYCSRGNELFEAGAFSEALECYDMALRLSPDYEKAILNRAILLQKIQGE